MGKKEVTVFLIEDDDVDAMTIRRGFRKQRIGNKIVRAKDGEEAMMMLQSGKVPEPYIILLDLNMPRMNGIEFLAALRKDERLKASVVFVLTTSEDDRDITASYEKNIAGYFVKGEDEKSFLDVIHVLDGYWKIVHLPENLEQAVS